MKIFNSFRKFEVTRTALGFALTGLLFTVFGIFILASNGFAVLPLIFLIAGLLILVFAVRSMIINLKKPSEQFNQIDRIRALEIDPELIREVQESTEEQQEYVFHFTGKLNQSYIMKDQRGEAVFEAICEKLQLFKDTKYTFKNCLDQKTTEHMISHTVSTSTSTALGFALPISSSFNVDGENCWDFIAKMGYGCDLGRQGLAPSFGINKYTVRIGEATMAGTGVMDSKYADSLVGKAPTNGIYRITCRPSDVEAVFWICFTVSRVELFSTSND